MKNSRAKGTNGDFNHEGHEGHEEKSGIKENIILGIGMELLPYHSSPPLSFPNDPIGNLDG